MTAQEVWAAVLAGMDPEMRSEFAGDDSWAVPMIEGALAAKAEAAASKAWADQHVVIVGRSAKTMAAVQARIGGQISQPLYRYGCVNRPPGYATVPSGYRIEPSMDPHYRHGIVVYDRPLSDAEAKSYELVPIYTPAQVEALAEKVAAEYDEYSMEDLVVLLEGDREAEMTIFGEVEAQVGRVGLGDPDVFVAEVISRVRRRHAEASIVSKVPEAKALFRFTGLLEYDPDTRARVPRPGVVIVRWDDAPEVDNYPYGQFKTKARWYIEKAEKGAHKGQVRVCKQTLDPKRGIWNKPHCETYVDRVRLGVGDNGRVYVVNLHEKYAPKIQLDGDGQYNLGMWYEDTSVNEYWRIAQAVFGLTRPAA